MNAATQSTPITVRHLVPAPATELFDDWLDPGKLAVWMRPADAKKAKVKVDPRVGGELDIVMHTKSRDLPHKGATRRSTGRTASPSRGSRRRRPTTSRS